MRRARNTLLAAWFIGLATRYTYLGGVPFLREASVLVEIAAVSWIVANWVADRVIGRTDADGALGEAAGTIDTP